MLMVGFFRLSLARTEAVGSILGSFREPAISAWGALALVLLCSSALGQGDPVFSHLTVKEGLSQGSVNCILQDSKGFMWFGTQDGLNRFDGYEFRVFRHDPADSTTIGDNFIRSITEDSSGTLWIRTLGKPGTIDRFDRLTETFRAYNLDIVKLKGARTKSVKAEYDDPSGIQWRGSLGGGVTRFDPTTGVKVSYKHDPADPKSLIDNRIYCIYGARTGTVWFGTLGGLERFDPRSGGFVHYMHNDADPRSVSDNWVWPIMEDRSGVLWVGTYRGGLNRFDRATGTFTHYRHDDADPRSLSGDQLLSLYQDRSGMIWVGMNDRGVDRFHPDLSAFAHFSNDPRSPKSLIDNNILSLCVDRSGMTWIGTRQGVERFDRKRETFTHFRHSASNPQSISDNQAQCFLQNGKGIVWIGMVMSGLDRYDPGTGVFSHYRHDPLTPRSLSENKVYSLAEDRDGSIWAGTYSNGLNRLDPKTGFVTRYLHNDTIPASIGAPGIFALCIDRDGVLWVGTFGGGLDRFERESGTFTHFRHNDSDPKSLSDNMVACLYEDHAGALWVGTTGGLNRLEGRTGTFKHYRQKDGLPNEVIFGILEDGQGNLWLSTNKGISRFDPGHETFRNYDYNDGLQGDEFNQNAFARDPRTGELYFGGSNGFNVFHPDLVRQNPFVPPVVFSSFTRYNTDDKEGKPIEEKGIDSRSEITLSYKDNVANIEFAALDYYNTAKNRYAYRLEGYSDSWIQLGNERRATFTNLDGGDYTLRVRGSNNEGVWNEEGATLRIVVNPPWWKTRWAYGLYGVMIFSLLYGVRSFEINRREQKSRVRESELRAKAAEAEKRALEAENARKTKEMEDARQLQLSMLPAEIPRHPGYDIAVVMKTATEVGGDYYDFSAAPDGTLNIALGDATGHGMQAGTIVTLMKGLFLSDSSRSDLLTFFNHCSAAIKGIRLGRLFMAFSLVRLNGSKVSFASAGMPPAYLYRSRAGIVEEILLKGMPLGAMKNFPYGLHELVMEDDDVLLLLTDGLPEQKNPGGEMFDYDRVRDSLCASAAEDPRTIIARLTQSAETWMQGAPQEDDITFLVIKKNPYPAQGAS
jgi:serine phosphatase RsbU (regulator of sigma subunit)/ligand-binding sensor domain-containing protein